MVDRIALRNNERRYVRSLKGIFAKIHYNQRVASIQREHDLPAYSLEELRAKYQDDIEFVALRNNRVNHNYLKGLSPSFDRIDNSLPYTFNNIQVMPSWMNLEKAHQFEQSKCHMAKRAKVDPKFYASLTFNHGK